MQTHIIDNTADLSRSMAIVAQHAEIGIDTEFDNNRLRYGMSLCVIQIATPNDCFIIDPLAICANGNRAALAPLIPIIDSDKILKILFSGPEDLQILFGYGCRPRHFFDLAIAAKVAGMGYPSFAGLALALDAGEMDKGLQISDWYRRPFSPEMLDYLVNDVAHLIHFKDVMYKKLQAMDRLAWMEEESEALLADISIPTKKESLDKTALSKFKIQLLPDLEGFWVKELLVLRDTYAQQYDIPTHYVFSNEKLTEISKELPGMLKLRDWSDIKGIHKNLRTVDYKQFRQSLEDIYYAGIDRKLSATENTMPKREQDIDRKELQRFTAFLEPIKQRLLEKYGADTQQLLLSGNIIKKIFAAKSFEATRRYAAAEIVQAGKELGLDVLGYKL